MMVDPDDFVITRRRKKYKFAKFANAANCFEFEQWCGSDVYKNLQNQARQVVVELGAGDGLFSVELAARYPQKTFVAVDVKGDRLQKGAYEALERKCENVFFVRARADQITELCPPHSLQQLWLTFPDPFPRKHSAGRRMTHPKFLEKYAQLLAESGAFYLKHDNPEFFCWSLEQLVAEKWQIGELRFDLHDSALPDDYKIMTTYEKRWLSEGRKTNFVKTRYQIR